MSCDHLGLIGASGRIALGGTLLIAGLLKWRLRSNPESLLQAAGISSRPLLALGFPLIIAAEITLGLWLVVGWWSVGALAAMVLFLVGATFLLSIAMIRGYRGGCACFGSIDSHGIGIIPFVRNVGLLAAAIAVGVEDATSNCARAPITDLPLSALLLAMLLLAACAAMYILMVEAEKLLGHVVITPGREHEVKFHD